MDLQQFKKEKYSDGRFSKEDVIKLREALYEDDGMTKEKGDILFDIKNTIGEAHLIEDFKVLFVEAITRLLLEDEISPGEIDDDEAKWLRAKMQSNGYRDKLDTRLLKNLKNRSINFPEILQYKGRFSKNFEFILYSSRFLTIFAVIISIFSSIVLFAKGTMEAIGTLSLFWHKQNFRNLFNVIDRNELEDYEEILVGFISSVDIYLFAMVLLIFGMGIYELFIGKMDPVERKADARPSWLQVSSIDDLKSSLGKVILMVLIVNFFKYSLDASFNNDKSLLNLSIGIVLVSLALFIANKSHGNLSEKE